MYKMQAKLVIFLWFLVFWGSLMSRLRCYQKTSRIATLKSDQKVYDFQ